VDDVEEGAYSSTPLVASLASEGEGVPSVQEWLGSALLEEKRRELMEKSLQKKNGLNNELFGSRVFWGFLREGGRSPNQGVQRENRNASQAFCRREKV
jgi:hypothetical protein